jgi:hypothetical protein
VFPNVNDHTEHVSRTTDCLATRFPNGATVLVKHYRNHRETWAGGFSRNEEEDAKALAANPLPSADLDLRDFKVNGHDVTFQGRLTMAFRVNKQNELIAFEGQNCSRVILDGKTYQFSESPLKRIAFAPSLVENSNEMKVFVNGVGNVSIPLSGKINQKKIIFLNDTGKPIKNLISNNTIAFHVDPLIDGKWLTIKIAK